MDADQLEELLDAVTSKETFLHFLSALAEDRRNSIAREQESPSSPWGPDAGGWENTTVDGFLEAMHAWALGHHVEEQPSWQLFAQMLMGGKVYE